MIYQFLYARKRDGYRQLNDWSNTSFNSGDIARLESLRKYTPANGIDASNLPECIYYYNIDCSIGPTGVFGKTSYVPAGSSKESGDRETSFVHKYIFTDRDYDEILTNPRLLFGIQAFCETVEAADAYNGDAVELRSIFTPFEALEPEEMRRVANTLGLDESDFIHFLYALIQAAYTLNKRVYFMLPSNDRNGSELAKKFCQGVFAKLPRFITANCGFMTYTDTFHNTTTNNIPGAISLVFVADNEANAFKLGSVAEESYVFNKRRGFAPRFEMDLYTKELLENLKKEMLYGSGSSQYASFFKVFGRKINPGSAFTPEVISAAYQFYLLYRLLKENNLCVGEPEQLAYLFHTFLQNPELVSQEIHEDVLDYTKRILAVRKGEVQLEYIAQLYGTYEPIKELLVEKVCDQCKEAFALKNNSAALLKILGHPSFKPEELLPEIYDRLYRDPCYYDPASLLVAINLGKWLETDTSSNERKIKNIFESIGELYKQYPGLVLHGTYIRFIFDVFKEILYKSPKMNYDDVLALYQYTKEFTASHPDCKNYFKEALEVANDIAGELLHRDIRPEEMKKLSRWKNTILKDVESIFKPILIKKIEQYEITEFKSILAMKSTDNVLSVLSGWSPEDLARIYPQITGEALQRIVNSSSAMLDDYAGHSEDEYNFILFKAAFANRVSTGLCSRILKYEGMSALKRLYDNISKWAEEDAQMSNHISIARNVFKEVIINDIEERDYNEKPFRYSQEVEDFLKEVMGAEYARYYERADSAEPKKGLKALFGKKGLSDSGREK